MEEKTHDILENLRFISHNAERTSLKLRENAMNPVEMLSAGLFERFHKAAESLIPLIELLIHNRNLDHGIAIILRSALLDSLIVLNLGKQEKDSQKMAEKDRNETIYQFCNRCISDGLTNTIDYLVLAQKHDHISDDDLKNAINSIVDKYEFFFEPYLKDGSIPVPKFKRGYGPSQLFEMIASDKSIGDTGRIYDSYLFFSKYDHYGAMYYEVSDLNFESKFKIIFQNIEKLISILANLYLVLLKLSKDSDGFVKDSKDEVINYIHEQLIKQGKLPN